MRASTAVIILLNLWLPLCTLILLSFIVIVNELPNCFRYDIIVSLSNDTETFDMTSSTICHKNPGRSLIIFRVLYGYPSVHGAVFFNRKSYGPVRCGFKKSEILRCGSVRFSYIVKPTVRCGAVFKGQKSYGAVRCGAVNRTEPNRTEPIGKTAP